jgi:Ca-activated chloride channel family protein
MRLANRPARHPLRLLASLALCAATLLPGLADGRSPVRDDDERRRKVMAPSPSMAYDFSAAEMGATPGGAQDISFFRDRVAAGEVPHANTFTPEGLFSEHDLPLATRSKCAQTLCATGEAMATALLVQPEVRYLAQLGFSSGLDPKTFKRSPVHLVAVIDKSGSMSGQPLELVKESLLKVLSQLGPDDELSIVLYGDRSHVYLQPTPIRDRPAIARQIAGIASAGSTNMEEGLAVGFQLASAHKFAGTTRVMLFTDERPNVGRTDAQSFMGMARDASRSGVGMTTVGVGVQFGAELATAISSVRGGNLFFFPDTRKMQKVFEEEFDTMVTELAYDMQLELRPARGLKIAGVYGIPGKALKWIDGGAISLSIETIFLSRKKGAIYIALASDTGPGLPETQVAAAAAVATVKLDYKERNGQQIRSTVALPTVLPAAASVGLVRGRLLVDQSTTLTRAATLHHEKNDQEGAYQAVHTLAAIYRQTPDPTLADERTLVFNLERTLAKLSGHAGEPSTPLAGVDRISGLPLRTN